MEAKEQQKENTIHLLEFLKDLSTEPDAENISEERLSNLLDEHKISKDQAEEILRARREKKPELVKKLFEKEALVFLLWR